ncbi:NADP-dependent oxidoreductase [Martelella mangrovi]|uniref:NADPH:quinone reductase-like Zn-dependent oxidoreductase n=1 Tax=Martelella mangrovi TaxID=1397477 RepID=A0ABV2I5X7_9HYPH
MKAVQFSEYGEPDVLKVVDVDEPHAGPGQVRIAARAAGVNPADWKRRSGIFRDFMPLEFPHTVGFEASGVVDEVGEGVTGVSVGDAVFGLGNHATAEYVVLKSWALKPDDMSFEMAAALPVAVETAWRILDQVQAKAGQTVLVSGASGAVGSIAVQLARHRGLTVIATASERNHDYLRKLGATPTTYGPGLAARVRELAPGGVDIALDIAGSGIIDELIEITGDAARVISIADFSASDRGALFSPTQLKNPGALFAEAARLYTEGALRLDVQKTFPMEKTGEAQALSAEGHVTGKLVISVP